MDYHRDVLTRTRRYTESKVGVLHTWNHAAAQIEGDYYQDLIEADDVTLQRVPDLRLWGQQSIGAARIVDEIVARWPHEPKPAR